MNEPGFGLITPPWQHAGRGFNGGFCFFNNMAVVMQKLVHEKKIAKALTEEWNTNVDCGAAGKMQAICFGQSE